MKKSYIKEAEQNVLNQAKFWSDFIGFIDSLDYSTVNRLCDYSDRDTKELFNEGFRKLRAAAAQAESNALARCYMIQGVGGKEAAGYSKKVAGTIFKEDYSVMQWLDSFYRLPSSWNCEDEDNFRKEIDEELNKE